MGEARADVKETIIHESIRLFLSKGYQGTSVKGITEAVASEEALLPVLQEQRRDPREHLPEMVVGGCL